MKKIVILLSLTLPLFSYTQTLSGHQIADKAQKTIKIAGVEAVSTMRILDDKGRERVRTIAQIGKLYDGGKTEKRLVRFLAPADVKGTGLLTFDYEVKDDDIWLYMPALRKTRRIVSSDKAKNFMGSEFSYADMTPPALDDFMFNILGEERVREIDCYKLEWIPNDEDIADENGFSKRVTWVGKEDFVLRKSVYYDIDEELHKELNVYKVKEIDTKNHKYRMMHLEMENLQNGRKSILNVDKIQFNPNVKNDYFTTRYLERE